MRIEAYSQVQQIYSNSKVNKAQPTKKTNDQEGYMLERHLVKLKDGQGTGSFVLNDSLYGGFYELRAYTVGNSTGASTSIRTHGTQSNGSSTRKWLRNSTATTRNSTVASSPFTISPRLPASIATI